MMLTVAICTWNRSVLLGKTLEGLAALLIPETVAWELLVVNNNSTDNTDEVIDSYVGRLPVRRLFEPTPGKSHALNLAVREARGDYILWVDDDVLVSPNWLAEYHAAFLRWPNAVFFGGEIRPWFEGQPPAWLTEVLPLVSMPYALRAFGEQTRRLACEGGIMPCGANWAIRTIEQRRYLYPTEIGPRPGSALRGEESEVMRAILDSGMDGWWIPKAMVHHYVSAERQTIRYLRSWYYGYGECEALSSGADKMPIWKRKWLYKAAVVAELKYRYRRCVTRPSVWIVHLKQASEYWGRLGFNAFCPYAR